MHEDKQTAFSVQKHFLFVNEDLKEDKAKKEKSNFITPNTDANIKTHHERNKKNNKQKRANKDKKSQ